MTGGDAAPSVIGELQADLLSEGRTRFDLKPFRLTRLVGDQ
jgi:hypothetical protein